MFGGDKNRKDGLTPSCKDCGKEYYNKNRERILIKKREHHNLHKSERAEYGKNYYKENKVKIAAKQKIYNEKNKEEISRKRKEYYAKNPTLRAEHYAANREKILESGRQYKATHKKERTEYLEKTYEKRVEWQKQYNDSHRKEKAAYGRAYRQTAAGKAADQKGNHRRRALIRGATFEDFSPFEIFERDDYICQSCGIKTRPDFNSQFHPKRPQLDHIIPLIKGGQHCKTNVQCLCRLCNMKKHDNEHFGDQMRLFG